MVLEIKEDMKVARRNIHLTCMTVPIDVSGHALHIIQQRRALASCCKQKSYWKSRDSHTAPELFNGKGALMLKAQRQG